MYNPSRNILNEIKVANLYLPHKDKEIKETFPMKPKVSFGRVGKI